VWQAKRRAPTEAQPAKPALVVAPAPASRPGAATAPSLPPPMPRAGTDGNRV